MRQPDAQQELITTQQQIQELQDCGAWSQRTADHIRKRIADADLLNLLTK